MALKSWSLSNSDKVNKDPFEGVSKGAVAHLYLPVSSEALR